MTDQASKMLLESAMILSSSCLRAAIRLLSPSRAGFIFHMSFNAHHPIWYSLKKKTAIGKTLISLPLPKLLSGQTISITTQLLTFTGEEHPFKISFTKLLG